MTKRILAILMLVAVVFGLLAACNKEKTLTDEEAKQIVLDHMGASSREVTDIHSHISETANGEVCFNVFVTVGGKSYTYQVHATSGEILSVKEGGHAH